MGSAESKDVLRGLRVLLVEDSFLVAAAMARALTRAGATVVGPHATAEDALQALDRCDVGVLDIHLRDGASYAVAQALLAAEIPFAFITGYSQPPDLPAALADVERVTKPVPPRDLRSLIHRLAGTAHVSP